MHLHFCESCEIEKCIGHLKLMLKLSLAQNLAAGGNIYLDLSKQNKTI